ncbi:MAG: cytochrome c [Deltaproteobacteria bacterium]|nr:cytochrome c [Deltaproteobacteria bacterium]
MLAKLKVVEPEEYQKWQKTWEVEQSLGVQPAQAAESSESRPTGIENPAAPRHGAAPELPAERGKALFTAKGCTACHSVTGQILVGPSLKGVFGHEVDLNDDSRITADENYIRESLTDPQLKVVKGFQPVMPTYKGTLKDEEINDLVAYIKSLGN